MKKGLNKGKNKIEDMLEKRGQLAILPLVLIILLAFLFLYPSVESQVLIVNVVAIDKKLEISSMDITDIKIPYINIFSRSNPTANLILEIKILEKETDKRISATIENVGLGKSVFPILGERLKGEIELILELRLDSNMLDVKGEKIQLSENG